MCDLKTHPNIHDKFTSGEFCVQRQSSHGFAQIECDLTIEQTRNRDSKTKGGLTGFTQHKGAVNRWILSQPARAAITKEGMEMASCTQDSRPRRELDKARIAQDEGDIQNVISTIKAMANPFGRNESALLQLSSGAMAEEVSSDLLKAKEVGERLFQEFSTQRLQTKSVGFSETIKKRKVLSFRSMGRKKTKKAAGREITFKADKKRFAEFILVRQTRNIQIDELPKYSLGPLPLAISTVHGTPVKTNKASMLLESKVKDPYCQNIPLGSVWVLDGMAILQQLKLHDLASFGDLASHIFAKQLVFNVIVEKFTLSQIAILS